MKKSKRFMALIITLLICTTLFSACGTTSPPATSTGPVGTTEPGTPATATPPPPPDAKYADEIVLIMDSNISVLNSHSLAATGFTNNAYRMYMDSLLYISPELEYIPMLATSYETEDYQTWIFHLREGVTFHNGDKFTSADVVYSWKIALEAVGSTAFENYVYAEECEAVDEYTVKFVTPRPYVDFPFHLTYSMTSIYNQRAIEEDPTTGFMVGTGAYSVAEFASGDFVRFERFEDYWGEKPITKTQIWRYVPEIGTRTIMLQNGEGHIASGITETDLEMFQSDSNFYVDAVIQNNPTMIQFNLDDPICGDKNFRMAVAHAIDRVELSLFSRGDWAIPLDDGATWGYSTPYRNPNIPLIPYDLDKAREYLAASSYTGQDVEFACTSNTKLAEALQEQLSKVGINLTVSLMDMPSFTAYTGWNDNRAQMLTFVHMLQANPVHGYRANFLPGSNNNRMRYNNPELIQMVEESMSVTGEEARRDHFYREQEIVAEDVPSLAVYWTVAAICSDADIGGMILPSSSHYDFRYAYLVVD